MTLEQLLHEKRDDIERIATHYGAHTIRIFGSVARGEAGPESDVDFLVDVGSDMILIPAHYETILGTVILNEVKNLREVCGEILHSLRSFRMTGMSLIFN